MGNKPKTIYWWRFCMDNQNVVFLEGTIVYTPEMVEKDGKKAVNFVVENFRTNQNGQSRFKYNCVAWGAIADRYIDRLKEGTFVRITGHLQDNVLELPEDKIFHYSKTCANYIEFE